MLRSGGGDLDLASSLEKMFGARSPNKTKKEEKLGKFWQHKRQKLGKNAENTPPIRIQGDLPHRFGVTSEIQKAKRQNLRYLLPTFWRQNLGF